MQRAVGMIFVHSLWVGISSIEIYIANSKISIYYKICNTKKPFFTHAMLFKLANV